jgi:uncharacterized CHY-type Zn-finger protein
MNKEYKCNYCEKYYKSYKSMFTHEETYHKQQKIKDKIENENIIMCLHCNKIFSTKGSLNRHLKDRCKIKNNLVNTLINEKNIVNNINNTNNTNNVNPVNITINNLTINNIKNPNTNEFKLIDICDIFEKEFDMVLKLIEKTYFNVNIEENHSFYVSNLQGQYVNQYQNNEFTTKLKKYFFDELFGISLQRIKSLYKTYKNKLFEIPKQLEIKEKIQALEDMRNENNPSYKSYLKLINVLAYDKKDLILNTFNKLKQLEDIDKNNDEIIWDRNIEI